LPGVLVDGPVSAGPVSPPGTWMDGADAGAAAARVDAADWAQVAADLDDVGCASLGQILTEPKCRSVSALYDQPGLFRSTVDMARYRFGSGQYRYFGYPLPPLVAALRAACYRRLLPVARDWADRRRRPAPWPDTLDEWLEVCHRAGQTRPTPILLRYVAGDWNALHRDLYGELVFPLQVAIRVRSARGWSAAPIRHGVSPLLSGTRHTLGLVLHDAT
jgi:hypothetical protein